MALSDVAEVFTILFADVPLGVDCASRHSNKNSCMVCSRMRSLSGVEILMEARCSKDNSLVGLTMLTPPSLAARQGAHDQCHLEEPYPLVLGLECSL